MDLSEKDLHVSASSERRITEHPILTPAQTGEITFSFNDTPFSAKEGEMISTALFAHGIHIFGTHEKDGAPQGIFCANGQCAQCLVLADGLAVKSCITPVTEGMKVLGLFGI